MALEDLCLVSGISFVVIYAAVIGTTLSIIKEQRQRELAFRRVRSPTKRTRQS